jgi:hypothetical protein
MMAIAHALRRNPQAGRNLREAPSLHPVGMDNLKGRLRDNRAKLIRRGLYQPADLTQLANPGWIGFTAWKLPLSVDIELAEVVIAMVQCRQGIPYHGRQPTREWPSLLIVLGEVNEQVEPGFLGAILLVATWKPPSCSVCEPVDER